MGKHSGQVCWPQGSSERRKDRGRLADAPKGPGSKVRGPKLGFPAPRLTSYRTLSKILPLTESNAQVTDELRERVQVQTERV